MKQIKANNKIDLANFLNNLVINNEELINNKNLKLFYNNNSNHNILRFTLKNIKYLDNKKICIYPRIINGNYKNLRRKPLRRLY